VKTHDNAEGLKPNKMGL